MIYLNFNLRIISLRALFISFLCLMLLPRYALSAPIQWDEGNGHYYEYFNTNEVLFWEAAQHEAQQKGGYLATITSPDEDLWIQEVLAKKQRIHGWLGGYQSSGSVEPDGGWKWVTGEPWDYTHWYEPNNEPNNFIFNDPNGESVLELGRFTDAPFAWNDMDPHTLNKSDRVSGYIVEWDSSSDYHPVAAPEPANYLLFLLAAPLLISHFLRRRRLSAPR